MYMYSSLVQISDESICGMDFHSALQKDWASNIAINTKPEAHPCFVGPHIGAWPNTHFQGLDPPPSPQTHGGLKGLGNSLDAWLVL